jgi:Nucleotidyltransferase/DNA polymerase involved in DNA repair
MERVIIHIDVNNAFLSWTAIDLLNKGYKYDIRNSYAVIGGDESMRRGIVTAKSMPCKKLGIKTAEPLYQARKKCPALKVYSSDFNLYKKMSNSLFDLIKKYTPDVEVVSIDECFVDYTKVKKLYGDPVEFAKKLQKEVEKTLGFTVNIGIAENKLCAKMASDFEKPNKIHTLFKEEIEIKMWPMNVSKLYGVGKSSVPKLNSMGIKTIKHLAMASENELYNVFKNNAHRFIESANGINKSEVVSDEYAPKGIGNSTTLERDINNLNELNNVLLSLSENVSHSLNKQKKYASVVAVSIKDKFFKTSSHQRKLKNPVNTSKDIFEEAKKLLKELYKSEPVRLIGIRLDNLTDKPYYQVSLFEDIKEKEEDKSLEKIVTDLKEKYGVSIIRKAKQEKKVSFKNYKDELK